MELVRLLEARSAQALDLDAAGRVLVRSDVSGTFQLYELEGRDLRPLTAFEEPVMGWYVPGTRSAVAAIDSGGNERYQLYRFELDAPPGGERARLEPLAVSPAHMHVFAGVARDGRHLAYVANRRNGVDFDVFLLDLDTLEETTVYAAGGWCFSSSGFSPGGRWLSFLLPGDRPLDIGLHLVDLQTGDVREVLAHPDAAARVGAPAWLDDDTFLVGADVGRDLAAVVRHDLRSGETVPLLEREWDLDVHASPDGSRVLVVANEGGAERAELLAVEEGGALRSLGTVPLPEDGTLGAPFTGIAPPLFSEHGERLVLTYGSPRRPSEVWSYAAGEAAVERRTFSPGPDPDADRLVAPSLHTLTSFDGEQVPLFLYLPDGAGAGGGSPLPVVVVVHGGPEAQSQLRFDPRVQGLLGEGIAVVVPNVRGSTGYGKRYASLDDTTRRLDSVADLAAIHAWLPSAGLDPARAALFGGSYGGYMVLAGVAFQPQLWAAGVAIVAISDLVTFLRNTSDYRRAHREREYGSLADDLEFLERASPMGRVDDIRAPLFLIHGENDPRVPVSEARQLEAALRARGVRCELVVYPDEGHGLMKLPNILDAYPRAVAFLVDVLGAGTGG